ncbi:guanylyl and adenylyl cyclase family member [Haematococcus lacustris]|uniref:Guanylyl and adenylyl cyclase family member n=1 Tax=Haematococcus lacustris TaxID=44745 RepID=A0A699ZFZ3_HAELA|nr:guanylyl and adenylyl cyclase family member [Haematococcus lacustris]
MTVEHALVLAQVMGIPIVQSPLMMYTNWPLLTSVYNISRPSLKEFGRLSFYPDTWQELAAVMRQVNATASDPVTGRPRHALCMPSETGSTFLFTAVLTSIMQTGGTTQGWLYDPLTLEPLTNNTAMLKALEIMWELSPFLRGFDSSSTIDMSQCAIALAPSSLFKSLHPLYSNAQFMGQLTMSPLPASTEVLDRSTMQLVPCTAQLCNSQRATKLGGQLVNLAPTSHRGAASFLGMTTLVPSKLRTAVYNLMVYICSPGVSKSYSTALAQVVAMPFVADDFKVADSLGSLYYGQSALFTLIGCKMPLVPRSAGSPADFAAAMTSMTAGLRAVRDSLGVGALREQLWGTTGFVPPTQPPPPTPPSPSPPLAGGPALSTPLLATAIAVPVGVCSLLMLLLAFIITHLRHNAKLQRSLLGHVLPPAAGDKATLVITDVQGSSKLWEMLPAGVMEASMKVHDELVRRLALDSSGYEWATEGDSQWPAELMAAGSPGQPLCLGLVCAGTDATGSHSTRYSTTGSAAPSLPPTSAQLPSIRGQLPYPTRADSHLRGTQYIVLEERPTELVASSEASLSSTATAPTSLAAGPEPHVEQLQRHNPSVSTLAAEPLVHSLPSVKRLRGKQLKTWSLSLTAAQAVTSKTSNQVIDGDLHSMPHHHIVASALGMGLLGLLALSPSAANGRNLHTAHCPDHKPSLSLSVKESASMSRPDTPSLGQGSVGWQRLCDLYREVEVEEPGALTVLAGLRVRVGMHTGLAAEEVLVQSRMGASSTTYGGAALVLAKAVQACAHGGQVTLSAATFVKLPVEELRAAGITACGGAAGCRHKCGAHGQAPAGAGGGQERHCPGPVLRHAGHPGACSPPVGPGAAEDPQAAATGCAACPVWHGSHGLHVSGGLGAAEGMGRQPGQGVPGPVPGHCPASAAACGWAAAACWLLGAGVDVGEVACDLTPANGRFNYRGRCLNRAARINGLAASGQVWCSQMAWENAQASCKPSLAVHKADKEASLATAQLPTSSASWTAHARQHDSSLVMAKSAHSATLHTKGRSLTQSGKPAEVVTVSPAPGPAALTAGTAASLLSGVNSLAAQWQQHQLQLHSGSQPGSVRDGEGTDRSSAILPSQGRLLALPGLLQPLLVRPLGCRELRGIPGQVALVQVSLAAHTSRGQLEAADRLGLMAPGLELNRGSH